MNRLLRAVLLTLLVSGASMPVSAQIFLSIDIAPPELPIYDQPRLPGEGYLWMPGYWDYDDGDYYWVPGTWVRPPRAGYLWTPGYWAWNDGFYVFRRGYWGSHVGYYGGVDYGHGYTGHGYQGGRWEHDQFRYNRAVNNIDVTHVHNTYNTTVINNVTINRVSYNGGRGGTNARPTAEEKSVEHETHVDATDEQIRHQQAARTRPELRDTTNHGRPPIAATPKAAELEDRDVVPARATRGNPKDDSRAGGMDRGRAGQKRAPDVDAGSGPRGNRPRDDEPRTDAAGPGHPKQEQRSHPAPPPRPEPQHEPPGHPGHPDQGHQIHGEPQPEGQPGRRNDQGEPPPEQERDPQRQRSRQDQPSPANPHP